MYPNMIYTKNEVLKKEGHIVPCECDVYQGVSVQMVAGQWGTLTELCIVVEDPTFWLQTIHYYGNPKDSKTEANPPIMLIGTKKDMFKVCTYFIYQIFYIRYQIFDMCIMD